MGNVRRRKQMLQNSLGQMAQQQDNGGAIAFMDRWAEVPD